MNNKILLATNNPGKVGELRELLSDTHLSVSGLSDYPGVTEVSETGLTFEENAVLKACGYAGQTGVVSLADDSGLEVTALGGRPGVLSARYGGESTPFAEKMSILLNEIAETGVDDRRARFVCALAIARPDGEILFRSRGVCEGRIALEPRGSGGFGYDPLFVPEGFEMTFGELPDGVKRKISHRARAFSQIIPFLRHFGAL